jgi:hypothetical protein
MPIGNEVNTQKNLRAWVQFAGPGPTSQPLYSGQDMSYVRIEGVTIPQLGGIDPLYIHDPQYIGRYKNVAIMISPPDLPSATMVLNEKRGGIPRQLGYIGCTFSMYELVGQCASLSDFLGGWTEYVMIYPDGTVISKDLGDRTTYTDDNGLEASIDVTFPRDPYAVGPLAFGPQLGGLTLTGTVAGDAVYGKAPQCTSCGTPDDGTRKIYVCFTGGAAAPPNVSYSLDGGATQTNVAVSAAANAEALIAIDIVGNYLVALSPTAASGTNGGYYYATIDPGTGIPGTFTKVTTGFVANKQPRDMFVQGNRLWICGDGGYIYYTDDVTAGVVVNSAGTVTTSNLSRIKGTDEIVVAAGATSAVVKTLNKGQTWTATSASPSPSATINALEVFDRFKFMVGTATGILHYTLNGGSSWTNKATFASSIQDIVAASADVIHVACATVTPTAQIYTSWNGGFSFTNTSPRITGLPSFSEATRIAVPTAAHISLAANNVFIAGKATTATNGYLVQGATALI